MYKAKLVFFSHKNSRNVSFKIKIYPSVLKSNLFILLLPGVVLVDEHDDAPGIGLGEQVLDDFVKILRFGVAQNLLRVGDANSRRRGQFNE